MQAEDNEVTSLTCQKGGGENLANPEFYTQDKYFLNERKIKTLSGEQKLREFIGSTRTLEEMLKEVLQTKEI